MWKAVVATVSHVLASVFTFTAGLVLDDTVWDMGHALVPECTHAAKLMSVTTVLIPLTVLWLSRRQARPIVTCAALQLYTSLSLLRSVAITLTILPATLPVPQVFSPMLLLDGVGRDFIFSGHTAFVASWVLSARDFIPHPMWAYGALHAVALLSSRIHYTIDIALAWLLAFLLRPARPPIELTMAYQDDPIRNEIFAARHEVYAEELRQYTPNRQRKVTDYSDAYNVYIVARKRGVLCGFIAITPPGKRKALERHGVSPQYEHSHEIRLLTVLPGYRSQGVAHALMYAAQRFIKASGGSCAEAMARIEVLPMYERLGMTKVSDTLVTSGDQNLVHVSIATVAKVKMPGGFDWKLPFPVTSTRHCLHGGQGLESLRLEGIHACSPDAWFQPAPSVLKAVSAHPDDLRFTPPTHTADVLDALATYRNLEPAHVLLGAGSSDVIYRCFWTWLSPASHVLLLSPTYAEYEHVLSAIGCTVTLLHVGPDTEYVITRDCIPPGTYDLVVLTNPNSPTGVLSDIMSIVTAFPTSTRVWVDETYIDFAGREHSLEPHVPHLPNLIICKSMSKVYALSGLRLGYAYANSMHLDAVRTRSPPWIVSRVAQRAMVAALQSHAYYQDQYKQTHVLRAMLAQFLAGLGWVVVPGSRTNFVMASLPPGLSASALVDECQRQLLYIRLIDEHTVRIAVKDHDTQQRMMRILQDVHSRLSRREGPCCQ